ncbi:TRAM domain-containing protein [Candidatus Saccharibacteria bacterium]|nr:TRAM domain-containing protein [Candidatus Saccharibacteria bacterium]
MEFATLVVLVLVFIETTVMLFSKTIKNVTSSKKRKVFVDTSALMDGRILNIARSNFLGYDLVITRSVLLELQLLADGKDDEKRSRARFGLDVANSLQRVEEVDVEIYQDTLGKGEYVDQILIDLAKKTHGLICTTDFNLNKVATTEGIEVLNVNDLAMALKNEYLPGEHINVKITSTGSNRNQGVGHLQNGTMVVVDNAASRINSELEVEVAKYIQTSAGRMIFAKIPRSHKK